MISNDALLIDELPAGSKLYYRKDGSVVIAGGADAATRRFYAIRPQRNIKHPSCLVQRMTAGSTNLVDIEPVGGMTYTTSDHDCISLLPTLFPALDEATWLQCHGMEDDMAWELAACLESHPRIHAGHYPIQYVALLLWQDDGGAMLDAIEQDGGHITTEHLCRVLGVTKLTRSMKQFIRMVKPDFCKQTYSNLIRFVLQQWEHYRPVFQGCCGITLDTVDLNYICDSLNLYPALATTSWFRVTFFHEFGTYYTWPEWIQRAYDFYLDDRKTRGKAVPASASSIETFLTQYIRSHNQLDNLITHAEEEFTQYGDQWLAETYPDEFQFEVPPFIADSELFRKLRTAGELREMAKKLRNCAAGCLHEAARGTLVFFAYEYTPDARLGGPMQDDPDHAVTGLLALRRQPLDHWLQTQTPPDWSLIRQKLVLEFKGHRNAELGAHAWRDLESFLYWQVNNAAILNAASMQKNDVASR